MGITTSGVGFFLLKQWRNPDNVSLATTVADHVAYDPAGREIDI